MLLKAFGYIFQSFLMTTVGYSIIGIHIKLKELIRIILLNILNIVAVRHIYNVLHIKNGSHVIIIAILYTLICKFVLKESLIITTISSLISFSLIIIQELIVLFPIIHIFKVDLDKVLSNSNIISFLIVIASNSLLIILFIIFSVSNYNIIDLDQYKVRK